MDLSFCYSLPLKSHFKKKLHSNLILSMPPRGQDEWTSDTEYCGCAIGVPQRLWLLLLSYITPAYTDFPEKVWVPEAAISKSVQSFNLHLLRELDYMPISRGEMKDEKNCRVGQSKDHTKDYSILQVGRAVRRTLLGSAYNSCRLEHKFQQLQRFYWWARMTQFGLKDLVLVSLDMVGCYCASTTSGFLWLAPKKWDDADHHCLSGMYFICLVFKLYHVEA